MIVSSLIRCAGAVVFVTATSCLGFTVGPSLPAVGGTRLSRTSLLSEERSDLNGEFSEPCSRREALLRSASVAAAAAAALSAPRQALADIEGVVTPSGLTESGALEVPKVVPGGAPEAPAGGGVTLFQTKSGLKYIELREGSGPTPRYGQLVSISYKAYVKLPDIKGQTQKLDEFDSDRAYLIKHGNGRTIPGLDEGLHTMKIGGKRRIIIPPKLGYVSPGVGPIPEGPLARRKLNSLLDKMIEVRGGNVVFDVELRSAMDDEADQGYYEDGSLSPEDFDTLRKNLQQAGIDARTSSFRESQDQI
uniref:peptidylprolyl isomerase n=1 Tax=Odontella aurita TaxID=265563 RepID=A0A7S4NDU7_9STRA|mmetsp:Transcript_59287/g.176157  ORF Transcript_59287/g.176157 Transcript_59287/m.176157 type:complete len:305 (+) Transcript_59287:89-1003(+)|eukprot:CAMPEP_0113541426 /NCGR_PEP_ID=MMETSP0015_2-20120614/9027_1 /TAXON_ID=2838 /ORGANISM="Odontella" /LENGTH=304 /DNA_ID=CAMNT_0000441335 /DNA_START=61 /DNA_END=975 /DNA_ORIENTATION=+ /assembly_acc=CAM_ASM_000160